MTKVNTVVKLTFCIAMSVFAMGGSANTQTTEATSSYSETEELRKAATTPEQMLKVIANYEALLAEGNERSALRLGNIYTRGTFVPTDMDKGIAYYRQSADLGHVPALSYLGNALIKVGRGEEAFAVYEQANAAGLAGTEFDQARAHVRGEFGQFSDPEKGKQMLITLAENDDDGRAKIELAKVYADQNVGTFDPSKSLEILQVLVKQGDAKAMELLALLYVEGRGVTRDLGRAIELYREAAEAGSDKALLYKAKTEVDAGLPEDAFASFQEAVAKRVDGAELLLARAHIRGELGALSDPATGQDMLQTLADSGADDRAQLELAKVYSNIEVGETDFSKSRELLEPLAAAGDAQALEQLARLYRSGLGVERDYDRAISLYHAAAKAGSTRALLYAAQLELIRGKLEEARASLTEAVAKGVEGADLELAQAMARNSFRERSDRAKGVSLLKDGVVDGDIEYVLTSLDLLSEGRLIVMDVEELMRLAETEADAGNTRAAEALIRFTRKRPSLLSDAWARRTDYLQRYEDILSDRFRVEETVRYKIADLGPIKSRAALEEMLEASDSDVYYAALVAISRADSNAYTYIIQKTLRDLGFRPGSANGRMTTATVRAIMAFCAKQGYKEECLHGPLGGTAVRLMASSLAALKKG